MVAREARDLLDRVCNEPNSSISLPKEVRDYLDNWIRCIIINYRLRYLDVQFTLSEIIDIDMTNYMTCYFKENTDKVVEYLKAQGYFVEVRTTGNTRYIHIEW